MITSETVVALYADYIKAQTELKNMAKDSSGYGYKYTSLDKLIDATKPILQKYNLAILQMPVTDGLITRLIHTSGEWIESTLTGDMIDLAKMNKYQVQGSQLTYFRRYAWASICGIASDDDLDANAPKEVVHNVNKTVNNSTVSAAQVKMIQTRISQLKLDEATVSMLKTHYNIESWNDLPSASMQGLVDWFNKKETV